LLPGGNNERVKYKSHSIDIVNEDPEPEPESKPEEDQEPVKAQPTDGQTDDSEDLKKDTIDDESHVLKWELMIRNDGKTKYYEAISKDGARKYIVEPHLPVLAMIRRKL
jgi:hypothetical protein